MSKNNWIYGRILFSLLVVVSSCKTQEDRILQYSIKMAGENAVELTKVLNHYKNDPEKLKAAEFLIRNMPGHCSYMGDDIDDYYLSAIGLFNSDLPLAKQRDSLLYLSETKYCNIPNRIIQDVKIIKADYLISNIDQSFDCWKNNPWASHLNFDDFCEWVLPYKCAEFQSLDNWRDTLSHEFSKKLLVSSYDDETFDSPFKASEIVRNELLSKIHPVGMFKPSGLPMLSVQTMTNMTFGRCIDYVNLGVLTYRSLGIPAVIDETPIWGRYRTGHSWYTILDKKGDELKSEWDISSRPGMSFFPYQRIPKVYRYQYSPNPKRIKYQKKSSFRYPFGLFQDDITDSYYFTSNVRIKVPRKIKRTENYAYVAVFSGHSEDWRIVDFSEIKHGYTVFEKLGRNILYISMIFDGKKLVPISSPFILHANGNVEFLEPSPDVRVDMTLRRKYYSSENVVHMKNRLVGGMIQASDDSTFSSYKTLYTITDLNYPDRIKLSDQHLYRYWRYCSPDESYCNVAELSFFDDKGEELFGRLFSNTVSIDKLKLAFDDDWLSFVEADEPNGNWFGVDFMRPVHLSEFQIIPRSDDNDIRVGDEYQLRMWDGHYWVVLDKRVAENNYLEYKNILEGGLYSIHNSTRGWDERPFIVRDGNLEWW